MKNKKIMIYVSGLISIITLIVTIIIILGKTENSFFILLSNIAQNIFAGTIVLAITYSFEYYQCKKDDLGELLLNIQEIKSSFSKLRYFNNKGFVEFEKYKQYYEDKYSEEQISELYKNEKENYEKEQKKDFEEIINTYIEIADKDYNLFWNNYKKIDFLMDFKHRKRNEIYNEVFYYIYYLKVEKIREVTFHFKEYKNATNGNYSVNRDILNDIQNEIFIYIENEIKDGTVLEKSEFPQKEAEVIAWGEDSVRSITYTIGNKVTKHLEDQYNKIYKKYYNKKSEN